MFSCNETQDAANNGDDDGEIGSDNDVQLSNPNDKDRSHELITCILREITNPQPVGSRKLERSSAMASASALSSNEP